MQYNFDKYFTKVRFILYMHMVMNNRLSFKKNIKNLNYIASIRKISILFPT